MHGSYNKPCKGKKTQIEPKRKKKLLLQAVPKWKMMNPSPEPQDRILDLVVSMIKTNVSGVSNLMILNTLPHPIPSPVLNTRMGGRNSRDIPYI